MSLSSDLNILRALCDKVARRGDAFIAMSGLPAEALKAAKEAVDESGAMEELMEERFRKAESAGTPWTSRKKFYPHPMLDKTGRLKADAIRSVSGAYQVGQKVRFHPYKLSVRHGRYQNDGTATIPARPFMADPSDEELDKADTIAAEAMVKELDRKIGGKP